MSHITKQEYEHYNRAAKGIYSEKVYLDMLDSKKGCKGDLFELNQAFVGISGLSTWEQDDFTQEGRFNMLSPLNVMDIYSNINSN